MKTRIILTLICTLVCLFTLITVASAETFYAGTVDELKEANQKAIDNNEADTIYITADIDKAPFVATTSVTYILQANWTNCSTNGGAAKYADYVDIAFYADGGERTLTFTGNVLMTNQTVKPSNSSITYGGVNGGRLKVDMSKYTNLFMLSTRHYTINLYDVTFTGLRMDKNDWTMLSGKVINIYDGARIENCSNANGPIIDAATLNIYGGEITNCYTKNNMGRLIYAANVNMFGGSIYGNYQYNWRDDGYTNYFIDVTGSANIYGGSIYGNYYTQSGANSGMIGQAGNTSIKGNIVSGLIETNYSVSLPLTVENVDGKFTLTEGTVAEVTSSCFRLNSASYSVVFKNIDDSVSEAFMVKEDGTLARSLSGATELSAPDGKWTLTKNWCVGDTVDLTKQGTYYSAIDHKPEADDFDCTTALVCGTCDTIIYEAKQGHVIFESLSYGSFCDYGSYVCDCTNDGCRIVDQSTLEYAPLITMLGYSVTENESGINVGMIQGFAINREAKEKYEKLNDVTLSYGAVIAIESKLDGKQPLALEDGTVTKLNENVIVLDSNRLKHDAFEIKITGINADGLHPEQLDAKIIYCGYVSDGVGICYINNGLVYSDAPAYSYNEIK